MNAETSDPYLPVLVTRVANNGLTTVFQLDDGRVLTANTDQPLGFKAGDVALWDEVGKVVRPVDFDMPFERIPLSIGKVTLKTKRRTLIQTNDILCSTPTNRDVKYKVGNSVEFRRDVAVIRRVAKSADNASGLTQLLDDNGLGRHKASTSTGNAESFDDFFGYEDVKRRALEIVKSDRSYRDRLAALQEKPINGVLFTGDPGTGKTFLARIIANETGAKFYPVSGPEITSQWVNRSEQNLRDLFREARRQPRAIIYFDEIDSIAGRRGNETTNDTQKFVGQLLSEMDGFNQTGDLTVIAATNNADVLDPALRRPGRFDWELDFPLPSREDRMAILEGLGARRPLEGSIQYDEIVDATSGWSGARLRAIWTNAAQIAAREDRQVYSVEDFFEGYERARELSWNGPGVEQ